MHEQNAVMGRANRLLAGRVTAIATSVRTLAQDRSAPAGKITFTGNPVRPPVIQAAQRAFCRAGSGRHAAAAGVRRQPGRARDGGHRAGGDRAAEFVYARAAQRRAAGAAGGYRCRARGLRPARRRRRGGAVLRRSAGSAWPPRIWSCRAPAPRRWPNSPPSAGPRSWCRCRTRSTRTSSPMPACWPTPAARCASSSANSRPSGWRPRSRALAADPRCSRAWRPPPNRPASMPPSGWPTW